MSEHAGRCGASLAAALLFAVLLTPHSGAAQERGAQDDRSIDAAEEPAPVPSALEDDANLQLRADAQATLREDIARLRRERSEISQTGPVVMMVAGYIFAPLVFVGVPFLLIGEVCDNADPTDCVDLVPAGIVLTGLGVAGGAVGIAGLVMALERSDERRRLADEIEDRERDLQSLSYDVAIGPDSATLQLRWSL